jgi:upstream activation factor subunit UAF30
MGFMSEHQPDAALGVIVGGNPIPRTEITKKLWSLHQEARTAGRPRATDDQRGRRAAPRVRRQAKVSMFEMTKLINKHLSPA